MLLAGLEVDIAIRILIIRINFMEDLNLHILGVQN